MIRYIFCCTLLLFASCTKVLDRYEVPYSGDSLVIFGTISPQEGARINISKLLNPNDEHANSDAIVSEDFDVKIINQNTGLTSILQNQGEGEYISNIENENYFAGDKIYLSILKNEEELVRSEQVTIPELVPNVNLTGGGYNGTSGIIKIEFDTPLDYTYYLITAVGFVNGLPRLSDSFSDSFSEIFTSCEPTYYQDFDCCYNYFSFSNACLNEERGNFRFSKERNVVGEDFLFIDSISISFSSISLNSFNYLKALSRNTNYEEAQEPLFLEGNIKGAEGIFRAENKMIFSW